jgi:non-homologous end joining protein Ku
VVQHLVGSKTSEIVDRDRIVKGYEFERARYVTITDDDLKDLEVESSKIIDLDRFVDRDKVDPIYLEVPSYIYPEASSRRRRSGSSARRWRTRTRSGLAVSRSRAGRGRF